MKAVLMRIAIALPWALAWFLLTVIGVFLIVANYDDTEWFERVERALRELEGDLDLDWWPLR